MQFAVPAPDSATQASLGSFIFLGPTGVGKTELARALAEFCSTMSMPYGASTCPNTWRSTRSLA